MYLDFEKHLTVGVAGSLGLGRRRQMVLVPCSHAAMFSTNNNLETQIIKAIFFFSIKVHTKVLYNVSSPSPTPTTHPSIYGERKSVPRPPRRARTPAAHTHQAQTPRHSASSVRARRRTSRSSNLLDNSIFSCLFNDVLVKIQVTRQANERTSLCAARTRSAVSPHSPNFPM